MAILVVLTASVALLTAAVMAGIFLSFTLSVMPGLDAIEPEHSVRAMQSMNDKILNPAFLTAFMGVPVAAAATGGLLLLLGHRAAGLAFLAAAAVYVLGAFVPTAAVNVPLNDALAAAGGDPADAARVWADFSPRWSRWNAVRSVSSAVTVLLIGLALHLWARSDA
ncbi:anthrone oxygenase family protein [Streptomyces specialis]|uniref:anthrone oxygenase family protein n=1 Tax=Streptomyces specialis TaxID=498367 RepID=UPI00073F151E|nr:anthrone oxygenase family protein [Streptomyces specialis]